MKKLFQFRIISEKISQGFSKAKTLPLFTVVKIGSVLALEFSQSRNK